MNQIAPDRVLNVLNRLAFDLSTTGTPRIGPLVYEELKQRVLTLVNQYPEGTRAVVGLVTGIKF